MKKLVSLIILLVLVVAYACSETSSKEHSEITFPVKEELQGRLIPLDSVQAVHVVIDNGVKIGFRYSHGLFRSKPEVSRPSSANDIINKLANINVTRKFGNHFAFTQFRQRYFSG